MRCLDGDTEGLCQRHTVQYLLLQFQSSIITFVTTSINNFVVEQNKHNDDCHSCATFLPGHKVSNCQICHRKYILPLVTAFTHFHWKRILPFHYRHFVDTLSPLPKYCSRIFNHQWSCQSHFAQEHIVAEFDLWVIRRWNRSFLLKKEDWPQFKSLQKERRYQNKSSQKTRCGEKQIFAGALPRRDDAGQRAGKGLNATREHWSPSLLMNDRCSNISSRPFAFYAYSSPNEKGHFCVCAQT